MGFPPNPSTRVPPTKAFFWAMATKVIMERVTMSNCFIMQSALKNVIIQDIENCNVMLALLSPGKVSGYGNDFVKRCLENPSTPCVFVYLNP
jgi:hypothetical protein